MSDNVPGMQSAGASSTRSMVQGMGQDNRMMGTLQDVRHAQLRPGAPPPFDMPWASPYAPGYHAQSSAALTSPWMSAPIGHPLAPPPQQPPPMPQPHLAQQPSANQESWREPPAAVWSSQMASAPVNQGYAEGEAVRYAPAASYQAALATPHPPLFEAPASLRPPPTSAATPMQDARKAGEAGGLVARGAPEEAGDMPEGAGSNLDDWLASAKWNVRAFAYQHVACGIFRLANSHDMQEHEAEWARFTAVVTKGLGESNVQALQKALNAAHELLEYAPLPLCDLLASASAEVMPLSFMCDSAFVGRVLSCICVTA